MQGLLLRRRQRREHPRGGDPGRAAPTRPKTAREEMLDAVVDVRRRARPRRSSRRAGHRRAELRDAIRTGTLALKMTPGVHAARPTRTRACSSCSTASTHYLPEPDRGRERARSTSTTTRRRSCSSPTRTSRSSALAFKLEDGRYGQLTYCASTRARSTKGDYDRQHAAPSKRHKVGRARAHARRRDGGHRATRRRRHRRALRRRVRLGRHVHRRHGQRRDDLDARARRRSSRSRSRRRTRKRADQLLARRSTASPRKTRPSACTATRSRRRRSSPAWASSTSTSTSSA